MLESCLKTNNFGLKPVDSLVFGNSDLMVGVMDSVEYKGFNPNSCFVDYFLDRTHN